VSALVRLYPRAWRDRYGEEFLALLEARPPTAGDRFDILRGAVDARLHPQVRQPEAPESAPVDGSPDDTVVVRRLGYAALAGGLVWVVAWWFATVAAPVVYDGYGPHRDGSGALGLLVLSMLLLVGGLIGHLIVLPSGRRAARAGVVVAIPFLLMWSFGPWAVWFVLIAMIALVAFAIGSLGTSHWSIPATAAMAVGIGGSIALALLTIGLVNLGTELPYEMLLVITATATPIWLAVGGSLIHVRPIVPAA
jgi:hypothetical protein